MFDRTLDYFIISWLAGLTWAIFSHHRRDMRQAGRIIAKIEEMRATVKELEQ